MVRVASPGSPYSLIVGPVPYYSVCRLRLAFINHARPSERMRRPYKTRPSSINAARPLSRGSEGRNINENQKKHHRGSNRETTTKKGRKTTFQPGAGLGGTSGIDMSDLIHGLVPCAPICRLLPTLVHRGFHCSAPATPPAPIPLLGFPCFSSCRPASPPFLGYFHGECAALPTQLCLILVPLYHEQFDCFKGPPGTNSPPWLLRCNTARSRLLQPPRGVFVDLSVAMHSLRSSTVVHLCQILKCPPGLGFLPPTIVPN